MEKVFRYYTLYIKPQFQTTSICTNNSCAQHSSKHSLSFLLSANNLEVIKVTFVSNLYEANAVIFFFFFHLLYKSLVVQRTAHKGRRGDDEKREDREAGARKR